MSHRAMHSAAKGKGHDAYIREEKQRVSRSTPQAIAAFRRKRDEKKKNNKSKPFLQVGPDGYEPPLRRRNDPDMGDGFIASGY